MRGKPVFVFKCLCPERFWGNRVLESRRIGIRELGRSTLPNRVGEGPYSRDEG